MMEFTAAATIPEAVQLSTVQTLAGLGAVLIAIGAAWGTLRTSVKHVEDGLKEVKDEIKKLSTSIGAHSTDIVALQVHTKYGISHSPIQPNEEGKQLLEDAQFNAQYPALKGKVFTAMDSMNLRSLYDYERGALEALVQLKDDPLVDPLKEFAVNNPSVPLDDILLVGSWVIRDDYQEYKTSQ